MFLYVFKMKKEGKRLVHSVLGEINARRIRKEKHAVTNEQRGNHECSVLCLLAVGRH